MTRDEHDRESPAAIRGSAHRESRTEWMPRLGIATNANQKNQVWAQAIEDPIHTDLLVRSERAGLRLSVGPGGHEQATVV